MKKVRILIASLGVFALCLISTDTTAGKWEQFGQAFLANDGCMYDVKECEPAFLRFQCSPGDIQMTLVGCY